MFIRNSQSSLKSDAKAESVIPFKYAQCRIFHFGWDCETYKIRILIKELNKVSLGFILNIILQKYIHYFIL